MKLITLLSSFLALSILTPVLALGAINCEPKDPTLTTAQRTAYTKQCLAEAGSPANVKKRAEQRKKTVCEQNAKNKALTGAEKARYEADCVNKNVANEAAAMSAKPKIKPEAAAAPAKLQKKPAAAETGNKSKPAKTVKKPKPAKAEKKSQPDNAR